MRWGAMLALCAVTVTGLVGAACNADAATTSDTAASTYTEPLVAPPNVTPPVPRGMTKVVVNLEAEEKTAESRPA